MKTNALHIHEHIRLEAFLLSEQAGHPTGLDETFWTQAEAIVHGRTAVVAGAGKAVKVEAKPLKTAKPAKNQALAKGKAKPAAKRKK